MYGVNWIITNGTKSNLIQAEGIANHFIGHNKVIVSRIPDWQRLLTMKTVSKRRDLLSQYPLHEKPNLIIGAGRHSIPFLIALKRHYSNTVKTIYILDPRIPSDNFDFVVAKSMDRIRGDNVIYSFGSLNSLDPNHLDNRAKKLLAEHPNLRPPYLFIAIGGGSRTSRYLFTQRRCQLLINKLEDIISSFQGSVLITPSRRTGDKNICLLAKQFSKYTNVFFDSTCSSDTYHGMLGLANYALISNDSINMLTEARVKNIPIYHYKLPSFIHSRKCFKFINTLESKNYIKPFNGTFKDGFYPTLNESARIASILKSKL